MTTATLDAPANEQPLAIEDVMAAQQQMLGQDGGIDGDAVDTILNTKQYLTFMLGKEEYGLSILDVCEIREHSEITRVPNQPSHHQGVINLRGSIIPVFSLRSQYGIDSENDQPAKAVIIVINVQGRFIGLEADAVSDIINIHDDNVKPAPPMLSTINAKCISGLVTYEQRVVIMLHTENLQQSL